MPDPRPRLVISQSHHKNIFKHTDKHITYRDKTDRCDIEHTIYDLYTTLTMLGPKVWENTLLV